MRSFCRMLAASAAAAAMLGAGRATAQTSANLLLVVNTASADSDAVAKRYIARRSVPRDNVCLIVAPTTESISRSAYDSQIEQPIWKCITTARAHDRILYIVLTKGVPIRITGTPGRMGTLASVDSELTLLYRRRAGRVAPVTGFVPNPYFAGSAAVDTIKPFAHDRYDIYLVTRLDGYSVRDVEALIDKGGAPTRDGRFVLDERGSLVDSGGDAWLRTAAQRLRAQGFGERVVLDESAKVVTQQSKVLGYYSWGSNDPAIRLRHFDLDFVPGALAGMFVSTDGRTFKEPPANWMPANEATRESIYAGSHQSLIGDLIRDGVTGTVGYVDEPYLDATIRPEILFPAYVSGRNLAEAFYAATPYLSWQTLVIGDPLCAPFEGARRTAEEIDPGFDADTELPIQFAKQRLSTVPSTVKQDSKIAYVRAVSRTDAGNLKGARESLETAVIADPRFTAARMELAEAQERDGQVDRAIANYRAIVDFEPNQSTLSIALNNLAMILARQGKPMEALPYSERAVAIVKTEPAYIDTLAWVQHLLGTDKLSASTMRTARALGGSDPEILWHAAVIFAAAGDAPRAKAELKAALEADPKLAELSEIKALQEQLNPPATAPK
jgi:uncharacterized protein (TIGR03790 family)